MNIYFENTNGRTEYRNNKNDRGAIAHSDGFTSFGFWESNGTVLRCAHGKPSKDYKNPERAAIKWMKS